MLLSQPTSRVRKVGQVVLLYRPLEGTVQSTVGHPVRDQIRPRHLSRKDLFLPPRRMQSNPSTIPAPRLSWAQITGREISLMHRTHGPTERLIGSVDLTTNPTDRLIGLVDLTTNPADLIVGSADLITNPTDRKISSADLTTNSTDRIIGSMALVLRIYHP